jgi:hypothetical protein
MAARPVLDLPTFIAGIAPVYTHLLVVGWLTQLIMGVAHWMFPKYSKDNPRHSDRLAWTTYVTLNVGLILRALAEPFNAADSLAGWTLAVSALLQLVAGWAFVFNIWGRIKER